MVTGIPLQSDLEDFILVRFHLQVINVQGPHSIFQEPLQAGPDTGGDSDAAGGWGSEQGDH